MYTDFSNSGCILSRQGKLRFDVCNTLHEEADSFTLIQCGKVSDLLWIGQMQWWDVKNLFAHHMQNGAAGDQDLESRADAQQIIEACCRFGHMLKVIE